MLGKIAVHRIAFRCRTQMYPAGFFQGHAVPLLEKQDVRHDAGICIAQESVIRETDRSQKVCPVSYVLPHRFILLVHRAAGCDNSHYTAGTYKIQ